MRLADPKLRASAVSLAETVTLRRANPVEGLQGPKLRVGCGAGHWIPDLMSARPMKQVLELRCVCDSMSDCSETVR